jgi:hypothetical protein
MIKATLFILSAVIAGDPPTIVSWEVAQAVEMTTTECEVQMAELRRTGVRATCSHLTKDLSTVIIEAQIAVQLAELAVLRKRVDEVTRRGLREGWCKTVQRNGASPTAPYAFSKVEKYWPEGIKPTLGECIRLIGGTRDPVTSEPPEKIVAQLKRGYQ